MKRRTLRWLFVPLVLCLALALLLGTAMAKEIVDSGECGKNVTWTLDADGTLTISGTGDMEMFMSSISMPWYAYLNDIETVIIESGVTYIGRCAFSNCMVGE